MGSEHGPATARHMEAPAILMPGGVGELVLTRWDNEFVHTRWYAQGPSHLPYGTPSLAPVVPHDHAVYQVFHFWTAKLHGKDLYFGDLGEGVPPKKKQLPSSAPHLSGGPATSVGLDQYPRKVQCDRATPKCQSDHPRRHRPVIQHDSLL